jgi:hypothetical protein
MTKSGVTGAITWTVVWVFDVAPDRGGCNGGGLKLTPLQTLVACFCGDERYGRVVVLGSAGGSPCGGAIS